MEKEHHMRLRSSWDGGLILGDSRSTYYWKVEWKTIIKRIIKTEEVTAKTLESLKGKINHTWYIIPQGRYFLNRVRNLLSQCQKFGKQPTPKSAIDDLTIWLTILNYTNREGININYSTLTEQTNTVYSDACEHRIGDFDTDGRAWRYALPTNLQCKLSINLLKFIASANMNHLTMVTSTTATPSKILIFTYSSSALVWLYKASFTSSQPVRDKVARWLAMDLIKWKSSLHSQRIRGKHNIIADILSFDTHTPDDQLIHILSTIASLLQMPTNLKLYPLPNDIKSWIASFSRLLTNMNPLPQKLGRSTSGALTNGTDSFSIWESKLNGLRHSLRSSVSISCPLLESAVVEINTVKQWKTSSVGVHLIHRRQSSFGL